MWDVIPGCDHSSTTFRRPRLRFAKPALENTLGSPGDPFRMIETMTKKRQLTELTLWLAAILAAVVLTGFDGWQKSHSGQSSTAPSAQATLLR